MSFSLPEGWVECLLSDYVFIKNGFAFKSTDYQDDGIPLIRISDIQNQKVSIDKAVRVSEKLALEDFKIEKEDLLIAMSGATTGKVGVYYEDTYILQNQRVGNIKLKDEENGDKKFRNYLIQSLSDKILNIAYGGAQPNISPKVLGNIKITLPPLTEQKQIAKKLDKLLARVERIKSVLDNAPAKIKRFRQSVLASAVGGGFSDKDIEWKKLILSDVANVATGKTPLKSEKSFYENGTIPWLTSSVTGKKYVTETDSYVTQKAVDECKLKIFEAGTFLVAMYGEGKTRGQVTELTFSATINQACAAIIVDETKIEKAYLKIRLLENYAEIRQLAEGGNQPNLNLSKVRSISILVPTREEQKAIVKKVETLFAIADKMEANILEAQNRVDKLTQSILAKAFCGEL